MSVACGGEISVSSGNSEKRAGSVSTDRLSKITAVIGGLVESKFTGYIKVNFVDGKIGRVEKFEEILRTEKTANK